MFDISKEVGHYQFMDGPDKVITTNDPTEELYQRFVRAKDAKEENLLTLVSDTIDYMLPEEHKHYNKELPFSVKVAIMKEYFEFHMGQLEVRFPGSASAM